MRIYKNFNLQFYNAYRLNASCSKAYFPENEIDIIDISNKKAQLPMIILGNGNNVVLTKEWYDNSFVIFNGCFNQVLVLDNEIRAEAGATLLKLSEIALQHSLSGFEVFYDIPSSVGGAIVMNAGASGEEIKDLVIKVRYLDSVDQKIKELSREEIKFEYRNSFFQQHPDKIVLSAWFKLRSGDPNIIKLKMEDTKQKRWAKQPREYPNCGSVYKRPVGKYVGAMIDELGLKGYTIGGAKISEKHSGFIINTGSATGKDIVSIIEYTKERVRERFKVELETEQIIY